MSTRYANVPRCPACGGYGVYKRRRRWWQRMLLLQAQYRCHECGKVSPAHSVKPGSEEAPPPSNESSLKRNGA